MVLAGKVSSYLVLGRHVKFFILIIFSNLMSIAIA